MRPSRAFNGEKLVCQLLGLKPGRLVNALLKVDSSSWDAYNINVTGPGSANQAWPRLGVQ